MNNPRCLAGLDVGSETTCAVLVQLSVAWGDGDIEARILGIGEAPTSGVRVVAGCVNADGTEESDLGEQFTVELYTGGGRSAGDYKITFSPAFTAAPFIVVSGAGEGNSVDNFFTVEQVGASVAYVWSQDNDGAETGSFQNGAFNFIAIGN